MLFCGIVDLDDCVDVLVYLCQFLVDFVDIFEVLLIDVIVDYFVVFEVLVIVGDLVYGEYFSLECMVCYQVSGGVDGILLIVVWLIEDFVIVMYVYKEGICLYFVM